MLVDDPQWRDAPVVTALRAAVPAQAWAAASPAEVLAPAGPTWVPPAYAKALADLTD
jgi:hypothetical protein